MQAKTLSHRPTSSPFHWEPRDQKNFERVRSLPACVGKYTWYKLNSSRCTHLSSLMWSVCVLLYIAFFMHTNEFDEAKKVYHSRDNDYLSLVAIFRLDIPLKTMSIFDNAMEMWPLRLKWGVSYLHTTYRSWDNEFRLYSAILSHYLQK